MRQHIFVMIRYSVLSKSLSESWVVGRDEFENYRANLFATDRLQARQDLFERITLPSLVQQTKRPSADWLTVFLLVSEEMPEHSRQQLADLVSKYDWIRIAPLPVENTTLGAPVAAALRQENGELAYATVRLDDDDALSYDYFERLLEYVQPSFDGFCISFGKGVAALMQDGKFTSFREYYFPKCAQGMAFVNYKPKAKPAKLKSVYALGHHQRVDKRVPTILDSRYHSFLRAIHDHADTKIEKSATNAYLKMEEIEAKQVAEIFNIIL
ncbi:glycosyltransferase [Bordetella genomosp. 4]|uniref:Rhamnosyl transferase n=1 Tax=Bordetella genomosp. 4 TaxID=463044 RepID=A0A261U4P7_9BORD|nr:glycosyltransferase [Bordetella genomosp. 4]OZI56392.1 hypothetical protein CAL20_13230 [Bordetella genomosp. 4]